MPAWHRGESRVQQRGPNYKWEATTLEGFVQQLAVAYIARRYFFYVSGRVPQRFSAPEHDQRMLQKFDVARSKWSRYRRTKRTGPDGRPLANVQYLRYRDFWVLLATAGEQAAQRRRRGECADSRRDSHQCRRGPLRDNDRDRQSDRRHRPSGQESMEKSISSIP